MRLSVGALRSGPGRALVFTVATCLLMLPFGATGLASPTSFVEISDHNVLFDGTRTCDWANAGPPGSSSKWNKTDV